MLIWDCHGEFEKLRGDHLSGVSFDALMGSSSPMCGSSGIFTTALKPPPPPPPATAVTVYSGFAPAAQTPPEHASASIALGRRPAQAFLRADRVK